ncbi:MAG: hypothetical protein J3R72DRAFT_432021 [Linnemannia gamsii]|nr:MAG: hypothetical protein J3R72DRAFT_432021 [Linnemannia gamsii]
MTTPHFVLRLSSLCSWWWWVLMKAVRVSDSFFNCYYLSVRETLLSFRTAHLAPFPLAPSHFLLPPSTYKSEERTRSL